MNFKFFLFSGHFLVVLLSAFFNRIVRAEESQQILVHYDFSPIHLAELAKTETEIYKKLGDYEKELEQRLNLIKSFKWEYENSVFNALQTSTAPEGDWDTALFLASHPILVYRMLGRYSRMLPLFYENLGKNLEQELLGALETMRTFYSWPTLQDLGDASRSIFRLQEAYGMQPLSLADGDLHGIPTNGRLTARHCVELAEIAMTFQDSLNGGEWLKAARELMNEGDTTVSMDEFVPYWVTALRLHGKTWNIDDIYAPDVFADARSVKAQQYEDAKFNFTFTNRIQNFKAICRGEELPRSIIKKRSRGYCFLHKKGPSFLIAPEAVEVHSIEPAVVEVHNFFGDELIQDTSNVVFHSLMDASLHHTGKESSFNNGEKTTAPALIYKRFNSMLAALQKIEAMFGFSFSKETYTVREGVEENHAAPFLYMQAYSSGNFHEPCLNCEEVPLTVEGSGARIATAHFMLDNTAAGGDIAFTHLGLKISQNKGSALVFLDDGTTTQDYRRLRGLCPVLLGSTWMATKHIYENGKCLVPSTDIMGNFVKQ